MVILLVKAYALYPVLCGTVLQLVGDAFFGALPIGSAFFITKEIIMFEKDTKLVEDFLTEVTEQIFEDVGKRYIVAEALMNLAEDNLANTFNEEQMKLYKEFNQKRKNFYEVAEEVYDKKIKF